MNRANSVPEVVPSTVQPGEGEVANVSGNHFDKHGSSNAVIRRLMDRFHTDLVAAVVSFDPSYVLDAGCGEGRTTEVIHQTVDTTVGIELEAAALTQAPKGIVGLSFVTGSIYELPFSDDSFDVVVCTEVLEHLSDPGVALGELARVARRGVVVTVPREPWWRVANVARGAYLSDFGNTPGHVQHFTKKGLASLIDRWVPSADFDIGASTMWRVARITL